MPPASLPPFRRRRQPLREGPDTSTWTPAQLAAYQRQKLLNTPLAALELPLRVVNLLEGLDDKDKKKKDKKAKAAAAAIAKEPLILVRDLLAKDTNFLLETAMLGESTLKLLCRAIRKLGLTPPWRLARKPRLRRPAKGKRRHDSGTG